MTRALSAPATERNREPILAVLQRFLPDEGLVLEIASGTGQHALFFAEHLPTITWQPSDPDPTHLASIRAWTETGSLDNLRPPLAIDVCTPDWDVSSATAIVNINMVHICPWACCQGLMQGCERLLSAGALLYMYGPFKIGGSHTAPSNEAFDRSLRARNAQWGVRDLGEVTHLADSYGLARIEAIPMPANNFSVIFRKR